ncbi:MAG: small ribosomal subunit Rsm22 family protein [Desulfovibrionaceae bacterium]
MSNDNALFPEPDAPARELLEALGRALNKAAPVPGRHKAELPYAIRDLSRMLTEARQDRPKDYMGDPRSFTAYLRYFLPWNVYRLTRLFIGLNLNVPDGATVVDLGAGPLTVLLALWISRPHLREKRLTFVCLDRTPRAMRTGLDVFRALAPQSSWKVTLVKGGVTTRLRERADLLVAANTLNELDWRGGEAQHEQAEQTALSLRQRLAEGGRVLLVEPGVRDAARIVALLRGAFIELGFSPLSPCPHAGDCPMPGLASGPWCHFRFQAASAPQWLHRLAGQARLPKDAASLSFVYLSSERRDDPPAEDEAPREYVRAISEPFPLPEGRGQYACSSRGLTLIGYKPYHRPLAPGESIQARWPGQDIVDEKSGALVMPLGLAQERREAQAAEDGPAQAQRPERIARPEHDERPERNERPERDERPPRPRPAEKTPQAPAPKGSWADKARRGDGPRQADKQRADKPRGGKPQGGKPQSGKPKDGKPRPANSRSGKKS